MSASNFRFPPIVFPSQEMCGWASLWSPTWSPNGCAWAVFGEPGCRPSAQRSPWIPRWCWRTGRRRWRTWGEGEDMPATWWKVDGSKKSLKNHGAEMERVEFWKHLPEVLSSQIWQPDFSVSVVWCVSWCKLTLIQRQANLRRLYETLHSSDILHIQLKRSNQPSMIFHLFDPFWALQWGSFVCFQLPNSLDIRNCWERVLFQRDPHIQGEIQPWNYLRAFGHQWDTELVRETVEVSSEEKDIAEVLASLPCEQLDASRDICAICHQTMAEGEIVCYLPCGHFYHVGCIDAWLRIRTTCPLDNREIRSKDIHVANVWCYMKLQYALIYALICVH